MKPDDEAWLSQLRRHIDAAKCCAESNHRLPVTALTGLASSLETVFKNARRLLEGQETASRG